MAAEQRGIGQIIGKFKRLYSTVYPFGGVRAAFPPALAFDRVSLRRKGRRGVVIFCDFLPTDVGKKSRWRGKAQRFRR